MKEVLFAIGMMIFFFTLIIFSATGMTKQREECQSKGGVLMKDASGLVVCTRMEVIK